jgi:hypothetical protein
VSHAKKPVSVSKTSSFVDTSQFKFSSQGNTSGPLHGPGGADFNSHSLSLSVMLEGETETE